MPVLGLGTWRLGEDPARRLAEVAAVRAALRMGYRPHFVARALATGTNGVGSPVSSRIGPREVVRGETTG